MRGGHHYLARVRAMRHGRIRTMRTTQRQPSGGPATTTVVRCSPTSGHTGRCRQCKQTVFWFQAAADGKWMAFNAPLVAWMHDDDERVWMVEAVPHWVVCTGVSEA